jgi:hypothetical protein
MDIHSTPYLPAFVRRFRMISKDARIMSRRLIKARVVNLFARGKQYMNRTFLVQAVEF